MDIERRIVEIYQQCRNEEAIAAAFDALQAKLDAQIQARLTSTRQALLEHVDEDVHKRLQMYQEYTTAALNERERWLLALTQTELGGTGVAEFDPAEARFFYRGTDVPTGYYHLNWQRAAERDDHFYRPDHPLARRLIEAAKQRQLPPATLQLTYAKYGAKVSALAALVGQRGWLQVAKLRVKSVSTEEFLIVVACTDGGETLDRDRCTKLLGVPGQVVQEQAQAVFGQKPDCLDDLCQAEVTRSLQEVEARNGAFYEEETQKLDLWAEDLKFGLEQEIRDIDKDLREAKRLIKEAATLDEKVTAQRQVRDLEKQRNRKRRELYDEQDRIEAQRDELIGKIERQLVMTHEVVELFMVQWRLQ